jgi:carbon-monoxide dehydrogenase small subunit
MSARHTIHFRLNGESVTAHVASHETLVELLQDHFGLFGARESCAQGLCGCCTVLVDGLAVSGCIYLAAFVDGTEVVTIERAEHGDKLDDVQKAFAACGAFQCGFCTPGFVLMARQLLDETPEPSPDQIRQYLSGNLCRCGAYREIVDAVQVAARTRAKGKEGKERAK